MRILHLDAGKEMRGGQWQVLRLIEGLAGAGVESTLLARDRAPLFEAARKQGWRVAPLGLGRALLFARRHDLIHAHDARGHTLGALVRARPLVVARRVAFPIGSRWKYGRAKKYIAVSKFVKGVLIEGGVPADKIAIVYDGVPLLQPHGQANPLPHAAAVIADPHKGPPLATEACRLAGVELRLSSNLEDDLHHGSIFVYVSHSEGLGSGVLLAMSAGAAVIASNVGGLSEAVRHGENGLLVDNHANAFADAIRQLASDPPMARRLGDEARRTVLQRFTVEHMVRRTMEVYHQVLQ